MAIIDKDGYREDEETGIRYAAVQTTPDHSNRRKKPKRIRPADVDIIFGLFLEKAQGRLTMDEISEATGFRKTILSQCACKHGFVKKIAAVLAAKPKQELTQASVASNLAGRLLKGAEEHQMAVDELMQKTHKHFRGMKGATILKNAKEVKTLDEVGRKLYKLDTEEQKAGVAAPVLNVQFLMSESAKVVSVSATEAS